VIECTCGKLKKKGRKKMKKQIELNPEFDNFKEVIKFSTEKYSSNIAYKYKENPDEKPAKYIEKTYKQVGKDVKALATALLNRNLERKKVVIISGNRYEWVISYFAVASGGMVVAPMDRLLPESEIESLVKRSEANAVIFDEKYLEIFKKLQKDTSNNLETLICMDDIDEENILTIKDLIKEGNTLLDKNDTKYEDIKIDNDAMSIMLFTSGTTDQAKIVMLSQKNICNNIWAYQTHFKMLPSDTLLSFLPIHHTFESSITIFYGFYSGACVAFCDGLRHIQENLKEYEVTIFVAVPLVLETMYKKINKAIDDQGKTKLIKTVTKVSNGLRKCHIDLRKKFFKQILDNFGGKLRIILYGAASLDSETIIGWNNFGINSIQGYGLTETSPVLVAESETRHRPGSAGFPLDNVEIKILNPDKDGVGEILAKGPNIMLGYYKAPEKTEEAFEDGWFKTGDYGYIDKDGFLFITGRKKDIIVLKNGKNVYPQEIETLIGKLPYVAENMVYLREKTKTDTMLVAKIVYDKEAIEKAFPGKTEKDYHNLIWEDIKEINKNLVIYKHIKQIIITDEPMSKTTTQKVKRYEEIAKTEASK